MRSLGLDYTFHELRHYYASMLHAQGIPNQYAMELMGHGSMAMLEKVYQHIMKNKRDEIRDRLVHSFDDEHRPDIDVMRTTRASNS